MQFTLVWIPSTVLQFVSLTVQNSTFNNTFTGDIGGGKLTVAWEDPGGLGRSASGAIYTVRFNAIGGAGMSASISFGMTRLQDISMTATSSRSRQSNGNWLSDRGPGTGERGSWFVSPAQR
jgi:hypothetical protein